MYRVLSGGVLGVTYVTMYPNPDVTLFLVYEFLKSFDCIVVNLGL